MEKKMSVKEAMENMKLAMDNFAMSLPSEDPEAMEAGEGSEEPYESTDNKKMMARQLMIAKMQSKKG